MTEDRVREIMEGRAQALAARSRELREELLPTLIRDITAEEAQERGLIPVVEVDEETNKIVTLGYQEESEEDRRLHEESITCSGCGAKYPDGKPRACPSCGTRLWFTHAEVMGELEAKYRTELTAIWTRAELRALPDPLPDDLSLNVRTRKERRHRARAHWYLDGAARGRRRALPIALGFVGATSLIEGEDEPTPRGKAA